MKLRPLHFLVLALPFLVLAACAPATTPTALPTAAIVLEQEPSTPTQTPTQEPSAPASPPGCTNSASFVSDVTYPDNASVPAGQAFVKTWRIRNTGTCTWDDRYALAFADGEPMGGAASIPFQETAPGATLELTADLLAPAADGTYTGNYELRDPSGALIAIDGTRFMWVKIRVGTGGAPPASSGGVNATGSGTSGDCTFSENAALLAEMVDLINQARAANGLAALTLNAQLSASAMAHSIDMACHSSLSHYGSNGAYIPARIAAAGYGGSYWNECIYAQPPEYGGNAQAAVDWWLNDPPHRVILLSGEATEIGAGYAYVAGSTLRGYFTVDFGSP